LLTGVAGRRADDLNGKTTIPPRLRPLYVRRCAPTRESARPAPSFRADFKKFTARSLLGARPRRAHRRVGQSLLFPTGCLSRTGVAGRRADELNRNTTTPPRLRPLYVRRCAPTRESARPAPSFRADFKKFTARSLLGARPRRAHLRVEQSLVCPTVRVWLVKSCTQTPSKCSLQWVCSVIINEMKLRLTAVSLSFDYGLGLGGLGLLPDLCGVIQKCCRGLCVHCETHLHKHSILYDCSSNSIYTGGLAVDIASHSPACVCPCAVCTCCSGW
jgi:hypothetical protein